jgi:hypothetical protein
MFRIHSRFTQILVLSGYSPLFPGGVKRKPTFQHDIYCTYLYTQPNKRLRENNITMVKPVAGSHGMDMLYLATPSLQPLRDGLVEGDVEGFY